VVGCHQISSALIMLGNAGIVHQDLHLGNILTSMDGSLWKVADFGSAYQFPASGDEQPLSHVM